jgi:hypothetical protein
VTASCHLTYGTVVLSHDQHMRLGSGLPSFFAHAPE